MFILKNQAIQLFLIVAMTSLAYFNMLGNGFVRDDHLFIEKWDKIRSFKNILSLLGGEQPETQGKIFRPVRSIIYVFDYKLFGINPFYYHLQALFIHLASTVLVYFILRFFVRLWWTQNDIGYAAFFGALLFGFHPIHTETITYIAASMEATGIVFFFASFYLYLISRSKPFSLSFNFSVFFAFLAFFTYEMTLTLPVLILLYEVCFFQVQSAKFKVQNYSLKFKSLKNIPQLLTKNVFPYFFLAFLFIYIRFFFLEIVSRTDYLGYSFYHTMLIMVKVFARYIVLLAFPLNLTANHNLAGDFPVSMIPYDKLDPILSQSIFDLDILLSIAVLLSAVFMVFKFLKTNPFISFSIGWFYVSLLPVSYIIPHGGAMAEKFLYIPSFGFILLVIFFLTKLRYGAFALTSFSIFLIILSFFYAFLTFQRNKDWKNDITFYSSMLRESPNNLLALYSLGGEYSGKNDEKATYYYQKAIDKAPEFWEARYNLANIYSRQKKYDKALLEYKKVIELKPDFAPAKMNFDKIERENDQVSN